MTNFDQIPEPPEKPDPFECCGSGCVPCIFDYYEQKLVDWENKYDCRLADYEKSLLEVSNEKLARNSD